jgi:flavin-binding protein dodecin
MAGSTYNIIELVVSSQNGWEEAVQKAIAIASEKLTNVRIAEVKELDALIDDGRIAVFRAKIRLSFKVEIEPETL